MRSAGKEDKRRRRETIWVVVPVVLAVMAGISPGGTAGDALVIRDVATSEVFHLPLRNINGVTCFPLTRFADYMGLDLDWDYVEGTIRITFRDHVLRFAGGGSTFNLDGEIRTLPSVVVQTPAEIWMPLAFMDDPAGRLWEGDVTWKPGDRELLVATRTGDNPVPAVSGRGDGDFIVVIDPGHGGNDPGCALPDGRLEKEMTLRFCRRLADILEDRLGIEAVLTRSGDYDVDTTTRTVTANTRRADLFISIHFAPAMADNAFCIYRTAGNESKYTMNEALLIWEDQEAGVPDRVTRLIGTLGQAVSATGSNKNWVTRVADIAVLKGLAVPGILVEISDEAMFYGNEPVTSRTGFGRAVEAFFDGVKRVMESGR